MSMTKELSRMAVVALAVLAVALAPTGCGKKESGPATTQEQPTVAKPVTPTKVEAPPVAPKPVMPTVVKPLPTPAAMPAAFAAFQKAQSVPCALVPVVSAAPQVDGVMDEIYNQAAPLKFKFLVGGDAEPTAATTVRVVSTAKDLFIFYECQSPDMDALVKDVTDHDGAVWQDDSIEMFIDPTNNRQIDGYMHFAINALATTYEAKGPKGDADASWNPKMQVKAKIGKKAWTVEIALPFAELVKDPAKMDRVWAVNFNRMAHLLEGDEDTAWSPTGGTDSHVPSKFGCLWLMAGKVDNTK